MKIDMPHASKTQNNMPHTSKTQAIIIFCIVTIILLTIDMLSKKLAINSFSDSSHSYASPPSSPFAFLMKSLTECLTKFSTKFITLKYSLTLNTGISFGLFSFTPFVYTKLKYVILSLVFFMIAFAHKRKYPIYMSFFIAGSAGNLIDRFIYDGVVDFIELIILDSPLFVFNIADVYIQIGLIIYIFMHITSHRFRNFHKNRNRNKNKNNSTK